MDSGRCPDIATREEAAEFGRSVVPLDIEWRQASKGDPETPDRAINARMRSIVSGEAGL